MLTQENLARLGDYLDAALPDVWGLKITRCERLHGGASRETYSLDIAYEQRGSAHVRGLILRTDPVDSLIDTERALEFAAYRSVFGRGVPVPEAIALETDGAVLGKPFFLMERIEGGAAASPFQLNAYGAAAAATGRTFFSILGRIAAIDPYDTELPGVVDTPAPDECWRRELDHWAGVIAADALEPNPIAEAALRRLRANPPPPAERLAVVHGDYRSGNFLHDGQGRILAVLDWEMAHIGDPLEDLAWAMDPLWRHFDEGRAGGMLADAEAIALWEAASGLTANRAALAWWRLFASVKGLAIWLSSARAYADGRNTDPVLAFSGWYCTRRHEALIAAQLAAAPRAGLPELAP
jgi:aminoglycoside phosphotransferase (APT) family kinase protein